LINEMMMKVMMPNEISFGSTCLAISVAIPFGWSSALAPHEKSLPA
jgi:hypothetical protein